MRRDVYPDSLKNRDKFLAFSDRADSVARMIQSGFLSEEDRKALTALARDGSSPCRVSRRANALVLLDKGWNCQQVADALLLDDDTIRGWRKLFEQRGIEGITSFDVGGSASYLSVKQEDDLKAWVSSRHRPRRTRQHHTCSPAALRTRAQPDRKRLAISARQQALQHDLRKLRRYPRKSLPSMDVLRQRQGAGRFNHHTPMGKGQSLAPLV